MSHSDAGTRRCDTLLKSLNNIYDGSLRANIIDTPKSPVVYVEYACPQNRLTLGQVNRLLAAIDVSTSAAIQSIQVDFPRNAHAPPSLLAGDRDASKLINRIGFYRDATIDDLTLPPSYKTSYTHTAYRDTLPFDIPASFTAIDRDKLTRFILYVLNMRRDIEAIEVSLETDADNNVIVDFDQVASFDWAFLEALKRRFGGDETIREVTFEGTRQVENRVRFKLRLPVVSGRKRARDDEDEAEGAVKRRG